MYYCERPDQKNKRFWLHPLAADTKVSLFSSHHTALGRAIDKNSLLTRPLTLSQLDLRPKSVHWPPSAGSSPSASSLHTPVSRCLQVWRGLPSGSSALVSVVGPAQSHSAAGLPLLSGPRAHVSLPPALTLHEVSVCSMFLCMIIR